MRLLPLGRGGEAPRSRCLTEQFSLRATSHSYNPLEARRKHRLSNPTNRDKAEAAKPKYHYTPHSL